MRLAIAVLISTFAALAAGQCRPGRVHANFGGSSYYYSWRERRGNVGWGQANAICRSLCMNLVSMESGAEDQFIRNVVAQERLQFIWTGGQRGQRGWVWATGAPFPPRNQGSWSRTGGSGQPQPDNREGNEVCMAVLNNFYNDGVVWHDVGCSHQKPFICESRGGAAAAQQVAAAPAGGFRRPQQAARGFRGNGGRGRFRAAGRR